MEADSCSTANIVDEHKLEKLLSSLKNKIAECPTDTRLFPFAQREPVSPVGCFWHRSQKHQHWTQNHSHFSGYQGNPQVLTSPKSGYMHWARTATSNYCNPWKENGNGKPNLCVLHRPCGHKTDIRVSRSVLRSGQTQVHKSKANRKRRRPPSRINREGSLTT